MSIAVHNQEAMPFGWICPVELRKRYMPIGRSARPGTPISRLAENQNPGNANLLIGRKPKSRERQSPDWQKTT